MSLLGVDGVSVCVVYAAGLLSTRVCWEWTACQCVLCVQQVSCLHEPVGSGRRVSVCCVCSRSPVCQCVLCVQQVSCLHEPVGSGHEPVGSGRRVSVCCVCSRSPVYMSLLGVDGVSVCVVCAAGLLST